VLLSTVFWLYCFTARQLQARYCLVGPCRRLLIHVADPVCHQWLINENCMKSRDRNCECKGNFPVRLAWVGVVIYAYAETNWLALSGRLMTLQSPRLSLLLLWRRHSSFWRFVVLRRLGSHSLIFNCMIVACSMDSLQSPLLLSCSASSVCTVVCTFAYLSVGGGAYGACDK